MCGLKERGIHCLGLWAEGLGCAGHMDLDLLVYFRTRSLYIAGLYKLCFVAQ